MKMKFAFCAMLLCIASTIALGQQVSVNYDHNASFSQYHTYAWGSNNTNQIRNSILAQVAQQDINTAMQGKGAFNGMVGALAWPALRRKCDRVDPSYKN